MSWFTRLLRNMAGGGPREAGPPRSSTGASSFHLIWEMPAGPDARAQSAPGFVEVSATLEVLEEPRTDALYFWALQVDFWSQGRLLGGGHTGLQWNRRYPGGKAVNWGGYASAERGGFVLPGTISSLGGFYDDPNTSAYAWKAGRRYRFRVFRSPDVPGAWRSEVTDLFSGFSTTIRDLQPEAGDAAADDTPVRRLVRPLVWSEVFADCDAPSVAVRWTDLAALDDTGAVIRPEAVRVNYQAEREGGCSNTTVALDETGGILQMTNAPRLVEQGSRLVLPGGTPSV